MAVKAGKAKLKKDVSTEIVTRSSADGNIGKDVKEKVKTCVAGGRDKTLCKKLAWEEEAIAIQAQINIVKTKDSGYVDTTLVNSLQKRLDAANKMVGKKQKKHEKVEEKHLKSFKKKNK